MAAEARARQPEVRGMVASEEIQMIYLSLLFLVIALVGFITVVVYSYHRNQPVYIHWVKCPNCGSIIRFRAIGETTKCHCGRKLKIIRRPK